MKRISTIVVGLGLVMPNRAFAQYAPQPTPPKAVQPRADPGEIVCERVKEVGSRLIMKKICMTRLQWQEQKAADRTFTEGVQTQLGALRDGG